MTARGISDEEWSAFMKARRREAAIAAGEAPDLPSRWSMTEAELDAGVVKLCKELGLYTHHTRDSRRSDGAGFPDRVIAGRGGVIFRELKTQGGDLRPTQRRWRNVLMASGQNWAIWRPADLHSGDIRRELEQLTQSSNRRPDLS